MKDPEAKSAYIPLYRRRRPRSFSEVVGQQHVSATLKNALISGKLSHSYLFCGPKGTGKTSCARIFAKALNCPDVKEGEPCNVCDSCKRIGEGTSLNVQEMDAASHTQVEKVREFIIEQVDFAPIEGKCKVYIIDEAHKLSSGSFNALLKTLEEPPSHVIFIFATTEPQNIPETILSRCQRFNFKLITTTTIEKHLKTLAAKEKIVVSEEALNIISQAAQGSMRDAQSTLDQVISFVGMGQNIDGKTVRSILGITSQELLSKFSSAVFEQKTEEILTLIRETQESGLDLYQLTKELHVHFRNLLMAKISAQPQELIKLAAETIQGLKSQIEPVPTDALLHYIELLGTLERDMKYTDQPRIVLEVGLINIARPYIGIDELISRLEALEKGGSGTCSIEQTNKAPVRKKLSVKNDPTFEETTASDNSSLKQQWKMVLEEIRKKKPGLAACLELANPKELAGTILTLEFGQQDKFQKQTIERTENAKIIETITRQIFQSPIKVSSVTGEAASGAGELAAEEGLVIEEEIEETVVNGIANTRNQTIDMSLAEGDPVVRKALDVFGGEIVNNNNSRKGE